jgi:biopolymer transport protein ExbB/TolQ
VLTLGFYLLLSQLPQSAENIKRYFDGHWILYAETGLFFIGVAALMQKALGLILDHRALRLILIDAESLDGIDTPRERALELLSATATVPAAVRRSQVGSRIQDACTYVAACGSDAAFEDHLRYLADLAVETLSGSFALVRTITRGVPVLGVLGLVLGIAGAVHAINPQDLDASMPAIVAGFGAALDPLALGLGLAFALMFAAFVVERGESQVLAKVEHFGISQLAPCFNLSQAAGPASPLGEAEVQAAEKLLERTETLINWQTGLWQEALESLRNRWVETTQEQQSQFAALLHRGMHDTLTGHAQQLEEARAEFLKGFRAVGLELARVTAGLQQMGEEHQGLFHQQVTAIWRTMQTEMAADRQDHEVRMERTIVLFEKAAQGWSEDLSRSTEAITSQLQEIQQKSEILRGIGEQEDELIRLQSALTHNLQSVRAVEAFEESIHSLNAAVHMLTIRAKAHAA